MVSYSSTLGLQDSRNINTTRWSLQDWLLRSLHCEIEGAVKLKARVAAARRSPLLTPGIQGSLELIRALLWLGVYLSVDLTEEVRAHAA